MDWYPGGDLRKLVHREASSIDEDFVWKVAAQLTLAAAHIHAQKMVHRDIKLENVFLTEDGDVKVCSQLIFVEHTKSSEMKVAQSILVPYGRSESSASISHMIDKHQR